MKSAQRSTGVFLGDTGKVGKGSLLLKVCLLLVGNATSWNPPEPVLGLGPRYLYFDNDAH